MKIEDVTIDHIRRQSVVSVESHMCRITSTPIGFEDQTVAVGDSNPTRWHDEETCQDILYPTRPAWIPGYTSMDANYTFHRCFGECVPNQKIIPWDKDRFVLAHYTFIHAGYKVKRTVKFASGDEITYYKEHEDV